MRTPILAALAMAGLALAFAPASAQAPATACVEGAVLKFVCGMRAPEDLVLVPGSTWIIASGMADAAKPGSGSLSLIDPAKHTATRIYPLPASAPKPRAPFGGCTIPPDAARFSAHGLSIRAQGRGKATLYVVGHGGREAIEVFDVTSGRGAPAITWVGCVPTPAGSFMNSVAGLPGGGFVTTEFYRAPMTMQDANAGRNTGAVYGWKPGGLLEKLPGTDLPGANGIEVTPDGKYLFVAVTGSSSVMRYDTAQPEKPPSVIKPDFRTDNLRWGPDGKLLLAGPGADPACTPAQGRCPMGAVVGALDPTTLKLTTLLRTPAEPLFQGMSSALIVGKEIWLGSYAADRAAYAPLGK